MSIVKNIFKKYQTRPTKSLGQNFLVDKFALFKVISASDLKPQDIVLEIGPGTGVLTKELAKKAAKVIAVEKDERLLRILNTELGIQNVKFIHADILKLNPKRYTLYPYKVVSNLPFYLTAPVIRKFLESEVQPELMVFVVQKEVAQRICAKPPKMNLLAVSVQFYADPKIISYIPKKSFWPRPKVDSAILRITPLIDADSPPHQIWCRGKLIDADLFFKVVRAGFSQPRKQLVNNLSKGLKFNKEEVVALLSQNNIKSEQRAETLTLENWRALAKSAIVK